MNIAFFFFKANSHPIIYNFENAGVRSVLIDRGIVEFESVIKDVIKYIIISREKVIIIITLEQPAILHMENQ